MPMTLSCNEDWPAAQERWTAFWRGEHTGRPVMQLVAPRAETRPLPEPESVEQQYLDPDFLYAHHSTRLGNLHCLAETLPCATPMLAGWLPAYGARLDLRPDTIWIDHCLTDWDEAPVWEDWENARYRQLRDILTAVGDRAAGEFMVGVPAILLPNDLLPMLRGTDRFLMDLALEPDRVKDALRRMTRSYIAMVRDLTTVVRRHYEGMHHHYAAWAPEQVVAIQSDVSCMLSGEMFEEFIVPELEEISRELGPAIYHLDGPDAIRHLPRICDIEGIRVIQWVPGAGHEQGFEHWPQVFKYAQERGKSILLPAGAGQLETAIREFRPELTFLYCGARDLAQGREMLESAARWTDKYW